MSALKIALYFLAGLGGAVICCLVILIWSHRWLGKAIDQDKEAEG